MTRAASMVRRLRHSFCHYVTAIGLCALGLTTTFSHSAVASKPKDQVGATSIRSAASFVWARSGDALTLDPHAVNEGTTHTLNHQIYEPLVVLDQAGKLRPSLATSWRQLTDPRVWSFSLRQGVSFHGGETFTARDAVFSLRRALSRTSDVHARLHVIASYRAVGDDMLEITTSAPDPLLPIRLSGIFMMSETWAIKHAVQLPQDYLAGEQTYAAQNANGTGAFKLVERQPGKLTRLGLHAGYWGWQGRPPKHGIEEIIYRPIPDDKSRIDALLAGTLDFVQDVPTTDLDVLRQAPGLTLNVGPENRVIFLGLSIAAQHNGRPNLLASHDVREAINIAIDRRAIQQDVMSGQSIPTAVLAPPGINGFPFELDEIPTRDLDRARSLIKQTVSANPGDAVLELDCPTNRYVNAAAICKTVAKQLSEIGITVSVKLKEKAAHFKTIRSGNSQFYLLGWGVPTFDASYVFTNLFHTRSDKYGIWNGTGFSDSRLDQRIAQLGLILDQRERAQAVTDIWLTAAEARIYVPLHVQTLMYATRAGVDIPVDISNTPKLKWAKIKPRDTGTSAN